MKPKTFTPGPWIAVHDHDKNFVEPQSPTPNEDYIAYCSGQGDFGIEVAAANARLISTAPDLLETLKTVLKQLENLRNCNNHAPWELIEEVRAAIAKAEGGQ